MHVQLNFFGVCLLIFCYLNCERLIVRKRLREYFVNWVKDNTNFWEVDFLAEIFVNTLLVQILRPKSELCKLKRKKIY